VITTRTTPTAGCSLLIFQAPKPRKPINTSQEMIVRVIANFVFPMVGLFRHVSILVQPGCERSSSTSERPCATPPDHRRPHIRGEDRRFNACLARTGTTAETCRGPRRGSSARNAGGTLEDALGWATTVSAFRGTAAVENLETDVGIGSVLETRPVAGPPV